VVDNLIVVHNIDQKSTNFYDIKLAEYNQPICVDNLDVDSQYSIEHYHSDNLFPEETANAEGTEGDQDNDNDKFKGPGEADTGNNAGDQVKQSKDYLEVNFQFNYTGEDDSPIKIGIDVTGGQSDKNTLPP